MKKYPCPNCGNPTIQYPDESYYGEMRHCEPCDVWAYFDSWSDDGLTFEKTEEPF